MYAEADKHTPRLFAVLVGKTSRARKGTSWSNTRAVLEHTDLEWLAGSEVSGLSSGEGLIERVRVEDPSLFAQDPKCLFVVEEEFGRTLQVMSRDGNILSAVTREPRGREEFQFLNRKTNSLHGRGYISILGHITKEELQTRLPTVDMDNGFANRFLWGVRPANQEGAGRWLFGQGERQRPRPAAGPRRPLSGRPPAGRLPSGRRPLPAPPRRPAGRPRPRPPGRPPAGALARLAPRRGRRPPAPPRRRSSRSRRPGRPHSPRARGRRPPGRGLSNGEIARRLYISTKTASVHVSNILTKLAMGSRTEVATWALRSGLAPPAAP
jgi:hypothetical protein